MDPYNPALRPYHTQTGTWGCIQAEQPTRLEANYLLILIVTIPPPKYKSQNPPLIAANPIRLSYMYVH